MKLTLSEIYQYLQVLVLHPARSSPSQRSTCTCRYLYCTVNSMKVTLSEIYQYLQVHVHCTVYTVPSKKLTLSEIYQYLQVLVDL
jgi:hypothetical protein